MNDELLRRSPQQIPHVVPVHGRRIFQNDDVARRLLPADDEFRNNLWVILGRSAADVFGCEFEVGMHLDDFVRRLAEAEGVLGRARTRNTVKFRGKNAEPILHKSI